MATINVGYELLRNSTPSRIGGGSCAGTTPDRMISAQIMHRISIKATEKIILLMNNTTMLTRHHRLSSINEALIYLTGHHEDEGMPGDRGDFYRRKLAEQIYLHFHIHNIDHTNIMNFMESLIRLECESRQVLSVYGHQRTEAPPICVDSQVLDIIARLADIH